MHSCCIIGEGGLHWPCPTFRVLASDRPHEPLDAKSPTGAWNAALSRINAEIEARSAFLACCPSHPAGCPLTGHVCLRAGMELRPAAALPNTRPETLTQSSQASSAKHGRLEGALQAALRLSMCALVQARSRRAAAATTQDGHSRPGVLWADSPRRHPADRVSGSRAPLLQVLERQAGPRPGSLLEGSSRRTQDVQ